MLHNKPYDHMLQLSTITCRPSNKLQQCNILSETNSDVELTLIIKMDLPSVYATHFEFNSFK